MSHYKFALFFLFVIELITVILNLVYGSVHIPYEELWNEKWQYIVWQSRMPAAVTSVITGMALGAAGLLLQSYFRNPLAGPSILGITSGANLAVAITTLCGYSWFSISSIHDIHQYLVIASLFGAMAILVLIIGLGHIVRSQITLLIVGMLISYLTSSIITLLSYSSSAQGIQQLMIWGMGDFNSVGKTHLSSYCLLICVGLVSSLFLIKPMNAWMQGENYSKVLGLNTRRTRVLLLLTTGWLAAITTAWCGPIAFIGLAMPHVSRMRFKTDDHGILLPASMIFGGICCGLCLLISSFPSGGTLLPINAITPIFGVPIILYIMLKK